MKSGFSGKKRGQPGLSVWLVPSGQIKTLAPRRWDSSDVKIEFASAPIVDSLLGPSFHFGHITCVEAASPGHSCLPSICKLMKAVMRIDGRGEG